jgi:hypothetical protein
MTSISCPFCNASLLAKQLCRAGAKILCPRCGEPLPARLVEAVPVGAPGEASPAAMSAWSNRKIGLVVLGTMLLMAAAGLILALSTQDSRRRNDYGVKRNLTPAPVVQASNELAGMAYLPSEVNLVAAVQVAEMYRDREAKKLLATPRPAFLGTILEAVSKWTSLSADDIDHIVVGTEISGKLPQITMIVETLRPFDPAALAKSLYPTPPTLQRGKPLYRLPLKTGGGVLWCPEPRILVFLFRLDALKIEDVDAIPLQPRQGADVLPPAIQSLVKDQRLSKNSLAWIVGRLDDPEVAKELFALAPLPARTGAFLSKMKAFSLSLLPQDGLTLVGHFRMSDVETARQLQKQIEELTLKNVKSVKAEAPPPGTTDPAAQWLTLQIRGDAGVLRDALGQ